MPLGLGAVHRHHHLADELRSGSIEGLFPVQMGLPEWLCSAALVEDLKLRRTMAHFDPFLGANPRQCLILKHGAGDETRTRDFIHMLGDLYIYQNHLEQVPEQLSRAPRPLPSLRFLRKRKEISLFEYEDVQVIDYDPYPALKAPIAV